MENEKLTEKNRVIIRVWTSQLNKVRRGENVGHVSIATRFGYMSLWPSELGKVVDGPGFFQPIDSEFKANYEADLKAEGRAPEFTICLYSLNPGDIHEKFESIKNKLEGWCLLGSNLLNRNKGESCASLAYRLIKAGGLYALVSSGHSGKHSSSVNPDGVLATVISAKKQELKSYPETSEFVFNGETKLDGLTNVKTGGCLVM